MHISAHTPTLQLLSVTQPQLLLTLHIFALGQKATNQHKIVSTCQFPHATTRPQQQQNRKRKKKRKKKAEFLFTCERLPGFICKKAKLSMCILCKITQTTVTQHSQSLLELFFCCFWGFFFTQKQFSRTMCVTVRKWAPNTIGVKKNTDKK